MVRLAFPIPSGLVMWGAMFRAGVRSALAYRLNFIIFMIVGFVWNFSLFVMVLVIFQRFDFIGGWSFGEISLLYGVRLVAHSLNSILFSLANIDYMIQRGDMERFLLRPRAVLPQVITSRVHFAAFGDILAGVAIFGYALIVTPIEWALWKVGYLAIVLLAGAAIEAAVRIFIASLAFRRVRDTRSLTFLSETLFNNFSNFPLVIYPNWLRWVLTAVLPVAFVAYFPALIILDRTVEVSYSFVLGLASPVLALTLFAVAYHVFEREARYYSGAGH